MAKYHDWTFGEVEALLNMVGGEETARAVLRGDIRLFVEDVMAFTGRVVKTITIQPYSAKDFAEAVRLGDFHNATDLGYVVHLHDKEQMAIDNPVNIDLVKFSRKCLMSEIIAWNVINGNKEPIGPAHLLGIAIQHPDEQRNHPIVEIGSVLDGGMLYLYGNFGCRGLSRLTALDALNSFFLVGFISK